MSILITGVAGFIGSNLAEKFLKQGKKVLGVDNLSRGKISNLSFILNDRNFIFSEIVARNYP